LPEQTLRLPVRHVPGKVVGLVGREECALERVVVIGRHEQLWRDRISLLAQQARERCEEHVGVRRRVVRVEDPAELEIERSRAFGNRGVLGDAEQIGLFIGLERIAKLGDELLRELETAREVPPVLPAHARRAAAEVDPRPEERSHATGDDLLDDLGVMTFQVSHSRPSCVAPAARSSYSPIRARFGLRFKRWRARRPDAPPQRMRRPR
jgi:hypothetical protein